jgi:hypothetical protein
LVCFSLESLIVNLTLPLADGTESVASLEKKYRVTFSGNPAISSHLRPVAFRPRLATGLAFFTGFLSYAYFQNECQVFSI